MKIIHTGDIHIGSALGALPPEKAALRKRELFDGFCKLVRYAKESGVAAVLIAGDLFDSTGVETRWKAETLTAIAQAAPVRFYYVSGNHDGAIDLPEPLPENLFTFPIERGWTTYDLGENVTLTGADTASFSRVFSEPLHLDHNAYNILLLHGDVRAAQSAEYVPLSALENCGVDYLALGHIHKLTLTAERLDSRGKYRYCGCLEGRGFDETGARGFFLLEIENGRLVDEKFLSFATRNVVEVRVDISACERYPQVENAALKALERVENCHIVKVVLCGTPPLGLRKDISLLCARLSEKYFFVRVEDCSRAFVDYQAYQNDMTERGEFVREAGRYEMTDEFRAEVLEVGLKALNGEEIDL